MGSQQDCGTTLTTMEPTLWSTATRICWTFSQSLATRSTFSIRDFSTNYCNLRVLYCNSQDGCHPVKFDFDVKEIAVEPSIGAGKNPSERCKLNDVWLFFSHPSWSQTPPAANSGEDCLAPSGHSPKFSTPPRPVLHAVLRKHWRQTAPQKRAQTARATASLPTIGCSHEDRGFSEDQIWFAGWLAPSKRYCKHFSWWWGSTFFEFWHFSELENDCSLTCRGMSFSSGLIAVACQRSEPGALFVDAVATYGSIQWKCDEVMILSFSPPARWGLLDFMSVASSSSSCSSSSCSSSSPPPPRPPRPPRRPRRPRRPCSTATRDPQCSLPDLNHDHPRPVFPAGPQPRPSAPSVPCRTSTTTIRAQCSLPDLNRDYPRPVFPAGPQPRPSAPSVPCRTSTATIRAQWSLPDLM